MTVYNELIRVVCYVHKCKRSSKILLIYLSIHRCIVHVHALVSIKINEILAFFYRSRIHKVQITVLCLRLMLKPEIINVESIEPSGITGLETEENFEQDYRLSQTMIRNSNKVGGVARVAFKSTVYFWSLNV